MSKIFKFLLFISASLVVAIDVYRFYDTLVLLIENYQDAISLVDKELLFILIRLVGAAFVILGCLLDAFKGLTKLGILLVLGGITYQIVEALIPILTDEVTRQALIDGIPDTILYEGLIVGGFLMIFLSQKGALARLLMAGAFGYLIYLEYDVLMVLFETFDFDQVLADSAKLVTLQSTFILAMGVFWPLYYPKSKKE